MTHNHHINWDAVQTLFSYLTLGFLTLSFKFETLITMPVMRMSVRQLKLKIIYNSKSY